MNILNKKIFGIFLLFLLFCFSFPKNSLALSCSESGGFCSPATSCEKLKPLSEGLEPCPSGQVCCETTTTSSSTPNANTYQEGSTGGFLLLKGHIVPCGRQTNDPGTPGNETESCTLCHLFVMLKNIFDLMFSLVIVAAILFITIGGVIYIVSTGNPRLTGMAKEIISKTLLGFGLMMVGWLLVFTLLTFLSTGNMVGKSSWFEFTCDTNSRFDSEAKTGGGAYGSGGNTLTGTPDNTKYTYQKGIASQYSDASTQLKTFLNCMESKLPAEAKVISSISDSHGMANCAGDKYSSGCAHTKNSCHYGGKNCQGKSYAVDFAREEYTQQIAEAANACSGSKAYVLRESNHTHVSIGAMNGCGCN